MTRVIPARNLLIQKHAEKFQKEVAEVEAVIAEHIIRSVELPIVLEKKLLGDKLQVINEIVRRLGKEGYTVRIDGDTVVLS